MLLEIESLDAEGRGIARHEGKVVFVEGALPGERVEARILQRKPSFDLAVATQVVHASPFRTVPRCPHFGTCGGCSLQHFDVRAQVAAKQRVLEDNLRRIGKVQPGQVLPPIIGPAWGYRHRARFSARYVVKKGRALIGFRERKSSFVTDMDSCEVVPPAISALLPQLRALVQDLSIRECIPQIELAVGESATVLVFRVLAAPNAADREKLDAFGREHGVAVYLQTKGPDTAAPLAGPPVPLDYALPEFGLRIGFGPTDFTQVNPAVNAVLVRRALSLLEPQPGERIADLFCGLGNFTLAIARRGSRVLGVEGSSVLLARAAENAKTNGLSDRVEFRVADLFKVTPATLEAWGAFDRMLIDPPRDGAMDLVKSIGPAGPKRIVYVSCNPSTLARDAEVLVHVHGYVLGATGVVNMFPHTAHVESVAVFDKFN